MKNLLKDIAEFTVAIISHALGNVLLYAVILGMAAGELYKRDEHFLGIATFASYVLMSWHMTKGMRARRAIQRIEELRKVQKFP